ncbi:MAG TPA: L,D-transpeptidase [Planctomycetota bacterium]|nr:L,D-transpeptidase [Planctomycetota bacterium]
MSGPGRTAVLMGVVMVAVCCRKERQELSGREQPNTDPWVATAARRASEARPALATPLESPKIVIRKSKRRLVLHSAGKAVRTYRVGLGFEPTGDKEREGDGRTPEGEFYVCNKNRTSKFYLSLGLSYPNTEDAARGLKDGLITREQHDAIVRAITHGERPPWDTALGGEIFIHGNGASRDWTWGCIALEDEDVRELFEAVPIGTPVVIQP